MLNAMVLRVAVTVGFFMAASAALSIWAVPPSFDIPIERLIRNLSQRVENEPRNAELIYTLGRAHSVGFAQTTPNVTVFGSIEKPSFVGWGLDARQPIRKLRPEELDHLRQSLIYYFRATGLDPDN